VASGQKVAERPDESAAEGAGRPNGVGLGRVIHLSREDRTAIGKAARGSVPRTSHAAWAPAAGRRGPAEILAEQAVSREPDLVPIRHARMLVSPFTFYRGAAALMAAGLAPGPVSGLRVQTCGDAHLLNFGGFASPERSFVFDVNDFDETLPGPFEWDVKRLAVSIEVAGRSLAFSEAERRLAVGETVRHYRETMRQFAQFTEGEVWYARLDEADMTARFRTEVGTKNAPNFERNLAKARDRDSLKAFSKLTTVVDGRARITADPPLVVPMADLVGPEDAERWEEEIEGIFRGYRRTLQGDRRHFLEQYRLVDAARKVVGVGSVGTRCWIVLLLGLDDTDPLFLQIKEAQPSVLAPFAGKSKFANQGQRVVEGQRLMQAASDVFLGWIRTTGLDGAQRDFYVRQLWDAKFSADLSALSATALAAYGRACAWTLARAHARSGDRVAIAAYLGNADPFDRAVVTFAQAYADQNEQDYEAFAAAVARGELVAADPALT